MTSTENEHRAAHSLFCNHAMSLNPSETCFLLHVVCVVYVIYEFPALRKEQETGSHFVQKSKGKDRGVNKLVLGIKKKILL